MPFRAVVLFCLFALLWASEVPTGVHPSSIVFYVPFKPFTCLDKSATIPWDKVNDDYCDCLDGSDEPGTSACPDMKFYCPNTGHEGVFIPSSFVNDMVCDCCDGSDEYFGLVKCNNTCGALAREREEQLQKRRKEIESGHQIYQEYVARKTIELAEEAKREAEEAEKRALEEAEKQTSNEPADSESDNEVPPSGEDKEEHSEEIEPDQIHEDSLYDEKHEGGEDMQDDGWNPPKGVEGGASVPSEDDDSAQVVESYEPPSPPPPLPPPPPPKPIDYGPDKGFMMLTEPSTGCLEVQNKEYIYSLCAFKEVRQRPRHHSTGGTLLGSWSGWVGHPEDSVHWSKEEKLAKLPYNEMLYDGGEQCWNGPSRSVKVKVVCGAQNRLMSAEEPSRCTYKMRLETPATCHHDPVKLMEMHTEL
ncbi:Glucosidase 2 subunit beta [Echinococcus granulosus]|nr:Glucosidase 2 subunit beta [Echinococcus granulosus]EUB55562.1 Glucosidase 2 subunit beta [Echinococcus granulosus]